MNKFHATDLAKKQALSACSEAVLSLISVMRAHLRPSPLESSPPTLNKVNFKLKSHKLIVFQPTSYRPTD